MSDALPVGTLLLDPGANGARATIYTVASARKLTAVVEGIRVEAVLTKSGLPENWKIIDNRVLAQTLKSADPRAVEKVLSDGT